MLVVGKPSNIYVYHLQEVCVRTTASERLRSEKERAHTSSHVHVADGEVPSAAIGLMQKYVFTRNQQYARELNSRPIVIECLRASA